MNHQELLKRGKILTDDTDEMDVEDIYGVLKYPYTKDDRSRRFHIYWRILLPSPGVKTPCFRGRSKQIYLHDVIRRGQYHSLSTNIISLIFRTLSNVS